MMAQKIIKVDEFAKAACERLLRKTEERIDELAKQKEGYLEQMKYLDEQKRDLELKKRNYQRIKVEFEDYLHFVDRRHEAIKKRQEERKKGNTCLFSIFIGNIPKTISYEDFKSIIGDRMVEPEKYAWKIDDGYCLLHFENDDQVAAAAERLNGLRIENQKVKVNIYHNSTNYREIISQAMFTVEGYIDNDLSDYGINNQYYWEMYNRQLHETKQMKQVINKIQQDNEFEEMRQARELEDLREIIKELKELKDMVDNSANRVSKSLEETRQMEMMGKQIQTQVREEYLERQAHQAREDENPSAEAGEAENSQSAEAREAENNQSAEPRKPENDKSAEAIQQSQAVDIKEESRAKETKEQSPTIDLELREESEREEVERKSNAKDVLEPSQAAEIQEKPTTRKVKENFQAIESKEQPHDAEISEQSQESIEGEDQTVLENPSATKERQDDGEEQVQTAKGEELIIDEKCEKTSQERESSATKEAALADKQQISNSAPEVEEKVQGSHEIETGKKENVEGAKKDEEEQMERVTEGKERDRVQERKGQSPLKEEETQAYKNEHEAKRENYDKTKGGHPKREVFKQEKEQKAQEENKEHELEKKEVKEMQGAEDKEVQIAREEEDSQARKEEKCTKKEEVKDTEKDKPVTGVTKEEPADKK